MFKLLTSPMALTAWGALSVLTIVLQSWIYLRVRSNFHAWVPVEATILESSIRSYTDMDSDFIREPVVRFSYSYEGNEYVSDTPYLRSFTLGPKFVDLSDIAKRYKEGDVVTARLHPQYPDNCYIEIAKFDFKSIFLLAIGIMAIGSAAYFFPLFIQGEIR